VERHGLFSFYFRPLHARQRSVAVIRQITWIRIGSSAQAFNAPDSLSKYQD
jgi:hypothetical protein